MNVEMRTNNGRMIIDLDGDLDLYSVGQAREDARKFMDDYPAHQIVINCEKLRQIDSSGIGFLIQLQRSGSRFQPGKVLFANVSREIRRMLRAARLEAFFNFADSA